jgi:hypothetical protein
VAEPNLRFVLVQSALGLVMPERHRKLVARYLNSAIVVNDDRQHLQHRLILLACFLPADWNTCPKPRSAPEPRTMSKVDTRPSRVART